MSHKLGMGKVGMKIGLGMIGSNHVDADLQYTPHSVGFVTSIHQKAQRRGVAGLL